MYSSIRPVEEGALNVFIAYSGALASSSLAIVLKNVNESAARAGIKRIVFHIFSDRGSPRYLEDLKELFQSNVLYTIVARHYELLPRAFERLLALFRSRGLAVQVFVDRNLVSFVEIAHKCGCEPTLI